MEVYRIMSNNFSHFSQVSIFDLIFISTNLQIDIAIHLADYQHMHFCTGNSCHIDFCKYGYTDYCWISYSNETKPRRFLFIFCFLHFQGGVVLLI